MMKNINKHIWYIWDGKYTSDRIAIAGRTGGCRVDSLRYSQQHMPPTSSLKFRAFETLYKQATGLDA